MKKLYIFVTSDRPDQYLNPIVFCVTKKQVKYIVFLEIEKFSVQRIADKLCRDVSRLTDNLESGIYKFYTGDKRGTEVDLSNYYSIDELADLKSLYRNCVTGNIVWKQRSIRYDELSKLISSISKEKEHALIDVSCVSKSYLADILSCCLLQNYREVYTFDLISSPNFSEPWKILVHNLKEGDNFNYINLAETEIFRKNSRSVVIRTLPLSISIIATFLFILLALIINFTLGSNSTIIQVISIIGTVVGIVSFVLMFFPIRGS